MAYFADDIQIVLPQQIIDIINTTRLRVFYRHEAIIYFAGGNRAECIGKAAVGDWFRSNPLVSPKIYANGLSSKGSTFALEGDCNNVGGVLRIGRSFWFLIR